MPSLALSRWGKRALISARSDPMTGAGNQSLIVGLLVERRGVEVVLGGDGVAGERVGVRDVVEGGTGRVAHGVLLRGGSGHRNRPQIRSMYGRHCSRSVGLGAPCARSANCP